jgi:glutamate synthase (NADPH/NADH) large chain
MTAPTEKIGLYDPAQEKDSCGVGFVAHLKGEPSHQTVSGALTMLENMDHRGACGCEVNSGDGAGILVGIPHGFLARVAKSDAGIELPPPGRYAVGMVFTPMDEAYRKVCMATLAHFVQAQGQKLLGWRRVPVDNSMLGPTAKSAEPCVMQIFIGAADGATQDAFERQLFLIRKQAYHTIRASASPQMRSYYVCSLSSRIMVYKGQLTSRQVREYFNDLREPDFASHLAMVHSRFSTNTFPSWDRAQPMRMLAHNGEINTLRGNVNWMKARQEMMSSRLFGREFHKLFPLIDPVTSDSGMFDNVLELLTMNGRSMPHVMLMMVPAAWQKHDDLDEKTRAFYEYHSTMMEPWDGPASLTFTDGRQIGALLDRNGLRPSRYYVTSDDMVVMASEVGALQVDPAKVIKKGRLQPGRMFLVDFKLGRIVDDAEIKKQLAEAHPYEEWLRNNRLTLEELPRPRKGQVPGLVRESLLTRKLCQGYTHEEIHKLLVPMATDGNEAVGSMGNDAALAVMSNQPRLVYDYFKQLFAQVTNPPIDPIREELVMSLQTYVGPEANLLDATPGHARRLLLQQPILSNQDLYRLKNISYKGWQARTIEILFERLPDRTDGESLKAALDDICRQATEAVEQGYSFIVLSDRGVDDRYVPVPALVAVGAVHQHLVKEGARTRVAIVVETGEAREVHHHCLLVGFGADAINPYLVFETLWDLARDGTINARKYSDEKMAQNYIKAVGKGILKVMSKMGISTLQSYKGAQIFEAIGLNAEVVERCFTGTASQVQGVGFDAIATEAIRRHELGFPIRSDAMSLKVLPSGGQYQWREGGEAHMIDPKTVAYLQNAAKTNSREAYATFSKYVDEVATRAATLRGLFGFKKDTTPIPVEEVEPASEIVKRFCTGAMSMGSISPESHETLAIAMNRIGGKSNTGEGGEDPKRNHPDPNGDLRRSAIKQVASGRFGVTIDYLTNADELQIKVAQGAKPGEGGQLPGHKVDKYIGWLRHSTPGVTLISPPPHHDIYSIEDLAQLIYDLKNANRAARISVKLVAETGVGTVAAGVAKAHADHILISGHDGGTGASPLTSLKHAGGPWELGLAETHQTLVLNNLRSRVTLQVDGQMKTGRDVVIGALLGAEEFGFSTAPLIAVGCIMMRVCHLNTCPVGIATQDAALRAKFAGKPEHVVNYFFLMAEEVRQHLASLGLRSIRDAVGRTDLLEVVGAVEHWKTRGLDLTSILMPAQKPSPDVQVVKTIEQDHGLEAALDNQIIKLAQPALEHKEKVVIDLPVTNVNRTVGTMLSNEIAKRYPGEGLPDDTVRINLTGNAGQSLGAWLAKGVTIALEGDANDYIGKGLSGGRIAVYPDRRTLANGFVPEENIIVGNVALYGATSGQAFFRGIAGERFCVRNSGAVAVVEGVGDHGCEYMTNGRAVILGPTGRNFAAGMSGGIAYVYDPTGRFPDVCNMGMIELERLEEAIDLAELRQFIELHKHFTGSTVAAGILTDWDAQVKHFYKVIPSDYKKALSEMAEEASYSASAGDGEVSNLPGGYDLPEESTEAGAGSHV